MTNTKLIKLLKTLSRPEIAKFRDFVNSPYFNKNINVIKLNDEVLAYYPDFDSKNFTEENIFKKIYGKEKFDYFKIRNIISDLYQLSLTFLKTIATEKKGIANEIYLLNEFHERKLNNFYEQKEKQISKQLESVLIKDEFHYETLYQLARVNTSEFKFIKSGYTFNLIQNEFDTFVQYSLIVFLRTYSKMLTNKNHGNVEFDLKMFEYIWEYVKDKEFENSPSCRIYKEIIALELSKDEKDYNALISSKEKYEKNLSMEDMYYILLVANSFAAFKVRSGDESFHKDRFKNLKEMIDRKIQLPEYILFVNFINTYTSACMVEEFEWAEAFLEKFRKGISPAEEISNAINYCKGFRAYRQKEYDKALEYFSKTNFKIFLMKVMVKSYSVRIYYEQKMHEQTFSAIDSFRHYLKSEKLIAEEHKIAHYEFLKFVSELTKLKLEGSKDKNNINLKILRQQIKKMNSNPLGAKNWLIEKAEKFNV